MFVRRLYNIKIGDQVDFVLSDEGILLKPVPKNHQEKTVAERLFGIFAPHKNTVNDLSKKDILKATKDGFTKGWGK